MPDDIEDDDDFVVMSEEDIEEVDDEEEVDMEVQEAPPRGRNSLAVRRAIEQRNEQRMMDQDLNYLELDFDEED